MKVFQPNMRGPRQVDSTGLTGGAGSLRIAVRPSQVLRFVNTHATQSLYINFGDGQETAVLPTDLVIPPSGAGVMDERYIRVPNGCFSMSYIASGANTLVGLTFGQFV